MTIQEIHNAFFSYFNGRGYSFVHGRRSQVNTLPIIDDTFSYPAVVMDPISYDTITNGAQVQTRIYSVNMAFLDLLQPMDSTSTQELLVVQEMDNLCAQFQVGIHDNIFDIDNLDTSSISAFSVQSIFWYPDAANNLAGVTASFTIETIDTFDYCADQGSVITEGIGWMTIGDTLTLA